MAVLFFSEPGLAELFHDGGEKSRRNGQVEKTVASDVVFFIDVIDLLRQALERLRILEVALDVIDALREPGPDCRVDLGGGIFVDFFRESFAKTLRGVVVAGETDDGELLG